jgi:hypothetical protein
MGLFNKKKDKVIDLTGYYEKNKDKFDKMPENQKKPDYEEIPLSPSGTMSSEAKEDNAQSTGGFFGGFFGGNPSSGGSSVTPEPTLPGSDSVNPDERRRKLAKRLSDMTTKIEDLSNQIYHLQQRLEVIERKLDVNRF